MAPSRLRLAPLVYILITRWPACFADAFLLSITHLILT